MLGRSWSLTEEENAMSKQKVVWIVFAVLVGIIAAASVWGKKAGEGWFFEKKKPRQHLAAR